jgi:hypothetical protein
VDQVFVDLGMSPLCESFLSGEELNQMEPFFPLKVWVCPSCFLVQLEEYVEPEEIFRDYAYFSSYSDSWLEHARAYVEEMTGRFGFGPESHVVELASNDGYLLQYFVERGIPCLGIEPARNVAEDALERGVPTVTEFFGVDLARKLVAEGKRADLIIGNNVLAQVPDLNDFVGGMKPLLAPRGIITLEFPHLMRLVEENQFDTIYHEHFSYFSLMSSRSALARHGLTVFDVEELSTHGGSLRVFAGHVEDETKTVSARARDLLQREADAGLRGSSYYAKFGDQVERVKRELLRFLIDAKESGRRVVGYGAPGKGNTLLNYCGIRSDLLEYTVDRNPHKQGMYLPGTHIPIHHPDRIRETEPDYVLVLPWNLKDEIVRQIAFVRDWGGHFVVPIPRVELIT